MTLEEAIIHAEEVAERCAVTDGDLKCESEHRQLAEWIKELKKYREENNWIPCSDRLPEKEGCYLITVDEYDRKDVNADFFHFREDGTPSWHYEKNVIAWMPFPEPYRGEQG